MVGRGGFGGLGVEVRMGRGGGEGGRRVERCRCGEVVGRVERIVVARNWRVLRRRRRRGKGKGLGSKVGKDGEVVGDLGRRKLPHRVIQRRVHGRWFEIFAAEDLASRRVGGGESRGEGGAEVGDRREVVGADEEGMVAHCGGDDDEPLMCAKDCRETHGTGTPSPRK